LQRVVAICAILIGPATVFRHLARDDLDGPQEHVGDFDVILRAAPRPLIAGLVDPTALAASRPRP
jgi:hypothetical protein